MDWKENLPEYLLRVAVCGTFLGHGIFAIKQNMAWLPFLTFWGFSPETSLQLMLFIGVLDVVIAITTLIKPLRPLLIYAAIWAFAAAMMRPVSGGYVLDFVERTSNFMAPLVLYSILTIKARREDANRI